MLALPNPVVSISFALVKNASYVMVIVTWVSFMCQGGWTNEAWTPHAHPTWFHV